MQKPVSDSSDQPTSRGTSRHRAKPWLITGGSLLAVAGLYFGGAAWISSQVPANTTVSGVQIGSLRPAAAVDKLTEQLADAATEPITLLVHGREFPLDPVSAGLGIDPQATVAELTRYEVNPVKLYERLSGAYPARLQLTVDEAKLDAALSEVARDAQVEVAEGTIEFADGKAELTAPVDGVDVEVDAAAEAVRSNWQADGAPIELPADITEPGVSAEALNSFYDAQVAPLLADPITLASDDGKQVELSPASIAAAAGYEVGAGNTPQLTLDDAKLQAAASRNSDFSSTAVNARVVLSGGKPKIIESKTGIALETQGLGEKIREAATTEQRTATVKMQTQEPEFTTEDARKLGIKQEIVEFSTPYPTGDTVRTKNLVAGSKKLSGIVVKPGETFSLLDALGPITVANGYFSSGVVENGFSTEAVGGGLSQISTQMYNVGFLAGYDDITHKPHSRWFDRYPAGREATLWEGQVDMKWKNNTPYGVMIQAWVGDNRVHTRLWSTKYWKVTEKSSGKHSFTKPQTRYNDAEQCISERGGKEGFSISITRYRTSIDGSTTLPPDVNSWTYAPWHKVVCGKKP